ncbi:hypothetical protein PHYBLDRAFT_115016, partial [Phycomyces blakesleeanus NRRL 1555(-)]
FAIAWKNARNDNQQRIMERENDVHWSELHELVYFNAVECTIIDPIHNLFLGTTKYIMEKWISTGLISNAHLIAMQDDADKLHVLIGYTSLRKKIIKAFPFMKADKWKSWCLVYSPTVLSGHLLQKHFDNWMCFVNVC